MGYCVGRQTFSELSYKTLEICSEFAAMSFFQMLYVKSVFITSFHTKQYTFPDIFTYTHF